MDQRTAKAEFLLHAAGEFARRPVAKRCQPGAFEKPGNALLPLPAALPEQPPEKIDILENRKCGVQVAPEPLGHVGHPRADAGAVTAVAHVAAEHLHGARLELSRTGHQGEQCGFSRAIRPHQPGQASGRNIKINVRQGHRLPKTVSYSACHHGPGHDEDSFSIGVGFRRSGHAASGSRRT